MRKDLMNTSEGISMYFVRFLPKTQEYVLFAVDSIEEMTKLIEESKVIWNYEIEEGHTISVDRNTFFKLIHKARIEKAVCYEGIDARRGFMVWGLEPETV